MNVVKADKHHQAPSRFLPLLKLDLTVNTLCCFAYINVPRRSLSRTLTVTSPDLPVCTGKRRYYPPFADESSAAGGSSSIVQMDMPGSGVRLANLVLLQGSSSCNSNDNKRKRKISLVSWLLFFQSQTVETYPPGPEPPLKVAASCCKFCFSVANPDASLSSYLYGFLGSWCNSFFSCLPFSAQLWTSHLIRNIWAWLFIITLPSELHTLNFSFPNKEDLTSQYKHLGGFLNVRFKFYLSLLVWCLLHGETIWW